MEQIVGEYIRSSDCFKVTNNSFIFSFSGKNNLQTAITLIVIYIVCHKTCGLIFVVMIQIIRSFMCITCTSCYSKNSKYVKYVKLPFNKKFVKIRNKEGN